MAENIDLLKVVKERFAKERMEGDYIRAAVMANCTVPTVRRALEKESYFELDTEKLRASVHALLAIMNERLEEYNKRVQSLKQYDS